MKTCIKCKVEKETGEFHKNSKATDGLQSRCKACDKARNAAYKAANSEKVKAQNAAWRKANPEKAKANMVAWRALNPEKVRAQSAAYYAANPEKQKARNAAWYKANLKKVRDYGLKREYNLTLEQYNSILEAQSHRCAICQTHQSDLTKALAVDHDHRDGTIRGLLCSNCNTAIGKLSDNPAGLHTALDYLTGPRPKLA